MIVYCIFILSGIPYLQYHIFYRQHLLSNTPWARDVFRFFNDSLFPDSSSERVGSSVGQPVQSNDWEDEFKCVMLKGSPIPAAVSPTSGVALQASAQAGPDSVSAAMQDLFLDNNGPASVPVPAATAIPTASAIVVPAPIPAVPGPAAVPTTVFIPVTPIPGIVPAGMPALVSAPIPAVVPVPGSQVFPTALQHQAMQQAPALISAPAPFVIPVSIPDDNGVGTAEADPPQTKTKTM